MYNQRVVSRINDREHCSSEEKGFVNGLKRNVPEEFETNIGARRVVGPGIRGPSVLLFTQKGISLFDIKPAPTIGEGLGPLP